MPVPSLWSGARTWQEGLSLGLRGKLVALTIAATVISSLTLFALFYRQLYIQEQSDGVARLSATAEVHAHTIGAVFQLMVSDAEVLSQSPPILSFLDTTADVPRIAADDRSTASLRKQRLERIFSSFLLARPHYTQVRFIGRAGNWRELVRVDRRGKGIVPTPDSELQVKGGEPYLAPSERLAHGGSYFSQVTYNRENGRDVGPPTIRLVRPLRNAAGQLFGAIVINADYEALLRRATLTSAPEFHAVAVTDSLDWYAYSGAGADDLRFHLDPDWSRPDHAAALTEAGTAARTVATRDALIRITPVFRRDENHPFGLYVTTAIDRATLFATLRQTAWRTSLAALSLVLLFALGAVAVANRITRPVRELTETIARGETDLWPMTRHPARDEIGRLAEILGGDLARETQQRRAIFSSVHDGIITLSETGAIEDVNPAAEALFGYDRADLLGRDIGMLMPAGMGAHHRGFLARASSDMTARAMASNRDIYGRRRDGSEVPLEISVSRAMYAGRSHFIGVVRDISLRKAAEERTARLVEALERSNQELDKFAYVASHDLRAPLRVIDNASRWLEEDLQDHLTEDTRESMAMLRSRVLRMERLLDDLLQHSRIGRQDQEAPLVRGDALVADLRALLLDRPGILFVATPAVEAIELPRMPILTVLLNLVNNAIKHHDRDTGRVTLDVQETATSFDFTVTDDGPGIPPEYHARVFEMFQTLKPRDEVDGSGMGLAMVLKHVTLAGGAIEIDSDGRGTRFRLHWPKRAAPSRTQEQAA